MNLSSRSYKEVAKSYNHIAFGNRVRDLRKKKKLTQMDLCAKMVIDYENGTTMDVSVLSRIERGIANITLDKVFLLIKSLEVHPNELLNFKVK